MPNPVPIDDSTDLEILGQLIVVRGLVEAFGEDLIPELDGFKVVPQLFSQLDLLHVVPIFARVFVPRGLPHLLVEFFAEHRLNLLAVHRHVLEHIKFVKNRVCLPHLVSFQIGRVDQLSLIFGENGRI